jgi:hypothetical protein
MFAEAPAIEAPKTVHPDDTIEFKPSPPIAPSRYAMLDLAARRVAIASYLYYRLDVSMMPDHEFDAMCQEVADHWDRLSPLRQFMLGSPAEISASGYHVKMTDMAVSSAHSWLNDHPGQYWNRHIGAPTQWKFSKEHQLHWTSIVSR